MLELHWDTLDTQTKEEILSAACVNERFQRCEWEEMDTWLRAIIIDSLETRSHSTVTMEA